MEVPPVAVEHDEEKEKEQGDVSEGRVLTDAGGLLVAGAVEAMKVTKVRSVEELADAPQHAQKGRTILNLACMSFWRKQTSRRSSRMLATGNGMPGARTSRWRC